MPARTWTILLMQLAVSGLCGQSVLLQGTAGQYSGEQFYLEVLSNPFTGTYSILDTLHIEQDGQFRKELEIDRPTWLKIDFGVFRSRLYLEPSTSYTISLPPAREKKESDIRNPFFRPVEVHIKVLREKDAEGIERPHGEDINSRLFNFDTLIFNQNKRLAEARLKNLPFNTDSMIAATESEFEADTSVYFRRYRNFRYGLTLLDSRDRMLKEVYEQYLDQPKPLPEDPAYMDLFSRMFEKFLFYYSSTPPGKEIRSIINRDHSLESLRDILVTHPSVPNDTIADMVILSEVNNAYYRDYFYKEAILMLLDSIMQDPSLPAFAGYAREIRHELTRLAIGSPPPEFHLPDMTGGAKRLEDFSGKYVYLTFCTAENYSCLTEYPFLRELHRKHQEYLSVVTIMVTETRENMIRFVERNDYDWTFLHYNNDEDLLGNFNVRAYPTSYLIGPEGKLIQSPATPATEGFEQQLFRIMRARGDL